MSTTISFPLVHWYVKWLKAWGVLRSPGATKPKLLLYFVYSPSSLGSEIMIGGRPVASGGRSTSSKTLAANYSLCHFMVPPSAGFGTSSREGA